MDDVIHVVNPDDVHPRSQYLRRDQDALLSQGKLLRPAHVHLRLNLCCIHCQLTSA